MCFRILIVRCIGMMTLLNLTACAVVDRFGSRVYDHNLTSQDVMNKEILVNIVRASRYQPLNFMAITQVNGGQSETLNTGLPTITFGPAQSIAQHQFPISNSVSSGATGSYQSNPLVSSQFQQGMMAPVTPKVLAYLLASHDRETVFHLVVDSINITSGPTTVRYVNDPANDEGLPGGCDLQSAYLALNDREGGRKFLLNESICNYSKFLNFMKEGMQYGVSAELVPTPPGAAGTRGGLGGNAGNVAVGMQGGAANATVAPQATGRLCWDPGLAVPEHKSDARQYLKAICGKKPATEQNENTALPFKGLGMLQFDLRLRSPAAIFIALGKLLRDGSAERVPSLFPRSRGGFGGEPLLVIKTEDAADCYVLAQYDGRSFCVPQGAYRMAMVVSILQELKNLSVTPSDLNSAFSVRVLN
jgi:hypothetical protein